ncbi:MAG: hypothetical protein ACRC76_06325 [Proteocatella sp.]
MIYVYEEGYSSIKLINKYNFRKGIILIDDDIKLQKKQNKNKKIANVNDIKAFLNKEINVKSLNKNKISRSYKDYKLEAEFSDHTIKEFIKAVGLLELAKLKNEVYILDDFFMNKSVEDNKIIIFKNKARFKIFIKDKICFTENVYKFSKYKLWKYENEYELIFFDMEGDCYGEF